MALGLFGSDISRSPDECPGLRRPRSASEPGNTEVEQLDVADRPTDEKQVAGLEIAMDDSLRVCCGDARPGLDALGLGELGAPQSPREIFSLEPLHYQERLTRSGNAVCDITDDARMRKRCEGSRFLVEAERR